MMQGRLQLIVGIVALAGLTQIGYVPASIATFTDRAKEMAGAASGTDFNGDGFADLAIGASDSVHVLYGSLSARERPGGVTSSACAPGAHHCASADLPPEVDCGRHQTKGMQVAVSRYSPGMLGPLTRS